MTASVSNAGNPAAQVQGHYARQPMLMPKAVLLNAANHVVPTTPDARPADLDPSARFCSRSKKDVQADHPWCGTGVSISQAAFSFGNGAPSDEKQERAETRQ